MNLETILNTANTRATQLGLPLVFGDTDVQNVAANDLYGDFFTLDIRRGTYRDTNVPNSVSYSIVVRCMGISAYMRDDAIEIATLIRTEMLLRDFLHSFICGYEVGNVSTGILENKYKAVKRHTCKRPNLPPIREGAKRV